MLASFRDCIEIAEKFNGILDKDFDGVEFVSVELPHPVNFKAQTDTKMILSSQDSNEEFEKFYKVLVSLNVSKTP
jgi:hypothetical protein